MKKYFRIGCDLILELALPAIFIIALLMAIILCLKPILGNQLQFFFILEPSGEKWNAVAQGWGVLWHAILPALTICGSGIFFGVSVGIAQYETIIGNNTRRRLDQAEQRYLNAESTGLARAKKQLDKKFESISIREADCDRRCLAAEQRADAAEQRAQTAECQLTDLAREARKSNTQGVAERHKRRDRQKSRADDDDYNGNHNPI